MGAISREVKKAFKLLMKSSLDISHQIIHIRDKSQHKKNRALLNRVFTESKHNSKQVDCHWCKESVFRNAENGGKKQKKNTATVDHIYDRRDLRRYLVTEEENTVIACYGCNQKRNDESIQGRKYVFNEQIIDIVKLCQ